MADAAVEFADDVRRDLPAAEELATVLYEAAEADESEPSEIVDWEDEVAVIARVEHDRLWFSSEVGTIGPRPRPRTSELAKVGWQVSAPSFGRSGEGWMFVEIGNVCPA
jgi:hypothetical protein